MTVLNGWENFYVIVGSSAGALIGLQFVVITLLAAKPIPEGDAQTGGAFATPSVVHFGVVLLLSAIASAPWTGITTVAVLWGSIGLSGVMYSVVVARRMRVQRAYQPVFEDWVFHALLPFAAYMVLAISAYAAFTHERPALFFIAAAALMLLFIGIHNAWDAVTYHVFVGSRREE
ncbi:MAG: hypothetical protein HQK59_02645 [Deltaproteobacteria bacterium]|nr:hypothetical protein [Deltaproteobacteria bacterium]